MLSADQIREGLSHNKAYNVRRLVMSPTSFRLRFRRTAQAGGTAPAVGDGDAAGEFGRCRSIRHTQHVHLGLRSALRFFRPRLAIASHLDNARRPCRTMK